jgi:hypothetical protein
MRKVNFAFETIKWMEEENEDVPEPIGLRVYSGGRVEK